jgi:uncharacterized repeat protein (TIGR01451 family)
VFNLFIHFLKTSIFAICVFWGVVQGSRLNKGRAKKFLKVFTMKTQKKNDLVRTKILTLILILSVLVTGAAQAETTNLLYVLADISANPAIISTYTIGTTGRLYEEHQYEIPYYGIGAVGLAIDSDSQHLFVTYEDSAVIQIIDATTMEPKGTFTIEDPNAENLAGIVYDHDNQLLYCVRRRQETLFVFNWNPATATLTPVQGSPFSLKGATAYGIALDEVNDLLYVANHTQTIMIYNTSDWSEAGTIELGRYVVSVAVDPANGFIYAGGGYLGNRYLTQYDLTSHNEREFEIEDGGGVLGICVDQTTGYVYMSTGYDGKKGGDDLLVYDTSMKRIDIEYDVGNPTGLVISCPSRNYFHLTKTVIAGIAKEVSGLKYVNPGGTVTYNISFDSNNLDSTANNVSIVDTLPTEVNFVTADEDGVSGKYDKDVHEYTWTYSSLPSGSSASLNMVVQVKENIPAGRKITNVATIDSKDTLPTTASNFVVTRAIEYIQLYMTVDIIGGIPEDGKCVVAGENITYRICFDNDDNAHPVSNVSIIDTLPENVSFVSADGDETYGHYDSEKHVYEWFYNSLASKSHICLELQVRVDPNVAPLTNIANSVSISSKEAPKTTVSVDVVTCESAPLEANMCIIPKIIGPRTISEHVLTVVVLPEGIGPNDVGYDMPILYIDDIEAIEAVDQYVDTEICSGTSVVAAFDKKDILNAAPHYGEVTLKVVGKLKSGETFYAETTAYLTEVGPFIWRWPTNCCP